MEMFLVTTQVKVQQRGRGGAGQMRQNIGQHLCRSAAALKAEDQPHDEPKVLPAHQQGLLWSHTGSYSP